jgi:hypothetical protein
MVAPLEGFFPNFNEAYTQLHLGQLITFVKCTSRDRHDGGIDPKVDHIVWNLRSSRPRVEEDVGLAVHRHICTAPKSAEKAGFSC